PDEIRSVLLSTASDMRRHVFVQGAGLVNATAAYERLQTPTVFAFPSFSSSSPLILSSGEFFEYQLDVFLNESFSSLNITTSSQLESYVDITILDQLNQKGWIRAKVQVLMPNFAVNGNLMIGNGSKIYFVGGLNLQLDTPANDAESGTDAGETFAGALPIPLGNSVTGELQKWDRDIYSFPVVKDQIYSVELENLTGNLEIFITNENGTVFNRSSEKGHLPEGVIFRAESSGNYFIRIEDKTPGTYVLLIREADEEELSLFPPAYLTGNIWSIPSDHDSDDLFDDLMIYVEANVLRTGYYNFWYSIAQNRPDYHFGRYVFMWDWLNLTLKEGLQNLTILIPGGLLESSGYTGSYVLNDLAFGKDEFSLLLYYELEVFTTPSYDYTTFSPLNNRLNSFSLEEEDIDKNGTPEKFMVELEFEFSSTGAFIAAVPIYNENHNDVLAVNNETFGVTEPGLVSVTIEFVAQQFENKGDVIVFGIAGSWFRYLIPIYSRITKENLSTFEPIFECTVTDQHIDTDNNGNEDAIRFSYAIVSKVKTEAILFTGHPYSYPNETMLLINTSKEVTVNQGSNTVWIDLDAKIFSAKDLFGPYFFPNLGLTVKNYDFTQYYPYVTEEYSSTNFDLPVVWFSSFLGGSKFENSSNAGLEVIWEITSTSQVEAFFEFDVQAYEYIHGSFSKALNFTQQVTPGVSNISFLIEAEELYNSSYIGNLEVYTAAIHFPDQYEGLEHRYQEHNLILIDFAFHAGALPNVHYGDYSRYIDAYFDKSPKITLTSTGLTINLTIGVNKAGTYDLEIDLFSENEYTTENISDTAQIIAASTGNYSYSFFFSAEKVMRNAIDDSVFGNASITNIESLNKSELHIPHFKINKSAFIYQLPIILPKVTS
ncbi:MAG: PPC domain-containing protein, partial [Candidatus Heimdallarchaeota archaeon]